MYVGSLDTKERVRILEDAVDVQYASGYLLFVRGTTLMAQRFDPSTLELSRQPSPLTEQVLVGGPADHRRCILRLGVRPARLSDGDTLDGVSFGMVAPDGQRILALTTEGQATFEPLTLLVNWPARVSAAK